VGLIEQAGALKPDEADGGFDPDLVVPPKDQRRMDRFILFAPAARWRRYALWHRTV